MIRFANMSCIAKTASASTFIFILLAWSFDAQAQDWPALRGVDGYGVTNTKEGVLKNATQSVQLKTRWKMKLGSGYSSVVVANDRVVTMFTDGASDLVRCLDADNGKTLWDFKTGPVFKGENGSFDGPLSTPLIYDGNVFALNATGELFCVSLAEGKEVWAVELAKEAGVAKPLYGFVTSPIIANGNLIVQIGGSEKSTYAIDPATGKTKWTAGDDTINSQSPSLIEVDGRSVLLAAGGKKLTGLDPTSGDVLFEFPHSGGNGQAMSPVPIGSGNVLLTLDDKFSKAVRISLDDDKFLVTESWQERSLKNTYNIPVLNAGNVFAYSTRILTCVDPSTGQPRWKTRKPGDGFLIVVDGYLIINTKKGSLHLAKASRDGYEELSQLKVFEDLVWSIPAYSDNSIFTRSLGEIARVDLVTANETDTETASGDLPMGPKFQGLLAEIKSLPDEKQKQAMVSTWLEKEKTFPFLEGDIATFVYRGDQADVAVAGDFLGARQEAPMVRVAGTNLHYYSIQLPRDQRMNYCFLVNYKPQTDPLNPREMTSTMYAGEMEFAIRLRGQAPLEMSWFGMPGWKEPEYLSDKIDVEPKIEAHTVVNEDQPPTAIQIQLPPGYDKADEETTYPVAYVFGGSSAQKIGQMPASVHRLFQGDNPKTKPAIIVYLNGGGPGFNESLANRIVPFVDEKFNTINDRKSRLLVSFGFAGDASLIAVALKNDLFGLASVQSPLAFAASQKMVIASAKKIELPTTIHFQWGRYDMFNPHENWDVREISERLFNSLKENKNIKVLGGMVNDSSDWSSWKNRYDEIFGLLND